MKFELQKPIEGKIVGCLCCGGNHEILPMSKLLAVGFGDCTVTKNGEIVYSENSVKDEEYWLAFQAEEIAAADPDNDWRVSFYGPLREAYYQRQGDKHWVLYQEGQGFA